ncbi:MAG: helix-turn-helix domain-containing protein [Thermoanaerobaculia bacterium]|nr:helix-turn-helix domain-containing protein [Acidobacteriota bacterium]
MNGSATFLRHARRVAGLTQHALSSRAGVTQASISRIEDGKTSPRLDTLDRLLEACGFTLELAPRLGQGVDRTAIRELLRLSPAERARIAVEEARNLERIGR